MMINLETFKGHTMITQNNGSKKMTLSKLRKKEGMPHQN